MGLLAAHGLRTASGPGQHATVGLFLVAICLRTDQEKASEGFDILRNSRNQLRYGATAIGSAESESAINDAASLLLRARMTPRSLPRQWFSGLHRTAQPRLT